MRRARNETLARQLPTRALSSQSRQGWGKQDEERVKSGINCATGVCMGLQEGPSFHPSVTHPLSTGRTDGCGSALGAPLLRLR